MAPQLPNTPECDIDLRTDTCTRPTAEMYDAMRAAPLGDDGWRDDPTVLELEERCAELLGKQAALFLPSGTMADLVALMSLGRRQGGNLIAHHGAWILGNASHGGYATIAGLAAHPIAGHGGAMDLAKLAEAIDPLGNHRAPFTSVISVENTHTAENGAVLPLAHMRDAYALASAKGVPLFLDGARLPHAAAALGVSLVQLARCSDAVSMSLCKALGAPAGSILAGTRETIDRALIYRKMLGGAMRQTGLLAACALVAIRTPIETIAGYHRLASRLADGLWKLDPRLLSPSDVVTNLLTLDVGHTGWSADDWIARLKRYGVLVAPMGNYRLRLLTHSEVVDTDIDAVIEAFTQVMHSGAGPER